MSLEERCIILQEAHNKMKRSHEELQDDHTEMTKEVKRLKTGQDDVVPWNIRGKLLLKAHLFLQYITGSIYS